MARKHCQRQRLRGWRAETSVPLFAGRWRLRRGLRAWVASLEQRKLRRAAEEKAELQFERGSQLRAWRRWRESQAEAIARTRVEAAAEAAAQSSHRRHVLRSSVEQLRVSAEFTKLEARRAAEQAAEDERERAAEAVAVTRAAAHRDVTLAAGALDHWYDNAKTLARERVGLAKASGCCRRAVLRLALRAWKAGAREQRASKLAYRHRKRRLKKSALRQWKRRTEEVWAKQLVLTRWKYWKHTRERKLEQRYEVHKDPCCRVLE